MAKRGNGEGTVTRNEARGRWEGRISVGYDANGKLIRRKVTGATRGEVVRRMNELRQNDEEGRSPARADLTVGRFLDEWLTDVLPGTVTAGTEVNYRNVVKLYLRPRLGMKRVKNLQARDVTRMMREMEAEGLSGNTRRLARSVLRRSLRWAEAEGIVVRNVAAIADGVKVNAAEGRTLTPAQARALLASLDGHRLEAAFTVALSLGLRRGELLGLAWEDVDLDAKPPRLTVRRALKRLPGRLALDEPKTRQSRRTVHLPAPVVAALRSHRARQAADRLAAGDLWEERPLGVDLVFRTPAGTAVDPSNFTHACYLATEQAGLGKWSPHELRHSAASLLIAQGVPLKVVSEVLGHSSIRVTADVYGHLLDDAKSEAATAMTAALWD